MKPTEETPVSATPLPIDNSNRALPGTSPSPSGDVVPENIKTFKAMTLVEIVDGRVIITDETVPTVFAEMNRTERLPHFDRAWFEMADGTLRNVPWIYSNAMPVEKINEYIELIREEHEGIFSRYEYNLPTLLKFQRVVISTAALVSLMLGERPNSTDVEMIREALTQVRNRLPCW